MSNFISISAFTIAIEAQVLKGYYWIGVRINPNATHLLGWPRLDAYTLTDGINE